MNSEERKEQSHNFLSLFSTLTRKSAIADSLSIDVLGSKSSSLDVTCASSRNWARLEHLWKMWSSSSTSVPHIPQDKTGLEPRKLFFRFSIRQRALKISLALYTGRDVMYCSWWTLSLTSRSFDIFDREEACCSTSVLPTRLVGFLIKFFHPSFVILLTKIEPFSVLVSSWLRGTDHQ